jgi:hypothetical protein
MSGSILIAPDLHVEAFRRLDKDVDILGKPVDYLEALGQRCAAFQLEGRAHLLQAVKAVHDPIVFFDQSRIDAFLVGNNPDQVGELRMVVQRVSWHAPPLGGLG